MKIRGGALLARTFAEKGITQVFTLSGGFCNPALEGFSDCGISVINAPHEQVAGHLADGTTRITRKPALCLVGPEGFANELENYRIDTYRKVLEVNLVGSFMLVKAVIPFMKRQQFGSIVNIGSIYGVVAPSFEIYEGMNITSPLVYSVAKAGIIHFCKWVAAKYGKWNIRCNAVSPGGLADSQKGGPEFEKVYSSKIPLGRMVNSTEVAELVNFLISDKSKYITGQNILIDGGRTIK